MTTPATTPPVVARCATPRTEKLYRIKHLYWAEDQAKEYAVSGTGSLGTTYFVRLCKSGWLWWYDDCPVDPSYKTCESLLDGKQQCEAHWKARIGAALEEAPLTDLTAAHAEIALLLTTLDSVLLWLDAPELCASNLEDVKRTIRAALNRTDNPAEAGVSGIVVKDCEVTP